MITKLTLINHESHKNTVLDLHPGLNVFVGESDRGKSGVFRAFDKVLNNKPAGKRMLPLYWEGECQIILETDNTPAITRTISESKNTYQIGDKEPINAGTDCPPSVAELLNMSDINLQRQTERAFLMFDTAGDRGRTLNKIAGLDKIDSTLAAATSYMTKTKRAKDVQKGLITQYELDLEQYVNLDPIEEMVAEAETFDLGITQKTQEMALVASIVEKRVNILSSIEKLRGCEILSQEIEKLGSVLPTIEKLEKEIRDVIRIQARREVLIAAIEEPEILLAISKLVSDLSDKLSVITSLETSYNKVRNLNKGITDVEGALICNEKKLTETKKLIPNVCPECGSALEK